MQVQAEVEIRSADISVFMLFIGAISIYYDIQQCKNRYSTTSEITHIYAFFICTSTKVENFSTNFYQISLVE